MGMKRVHWIQKTHLFRADEYLCSRCGASCGKPYKVCPSCQSEMGKAKYDSSWVAHNASFDMGVLRRCLESYEIEWKPYAKAICTVIMGRSLLPGISHKLNDMCDYYGIGLNHHQADSDSHAAAEILIRYMESGAEPEKYIRTYRMNS